MKRMALFLLAVALGTITPAWAETTLEKIARTGALTIGTRTGSPPFAYIDKQNQWVGFSIDLVEQGILPELAKKVGKPVSKRAGKTGKREKKESAPQTRIPLLAANAVDLIAETMTDNRSRRDSVDFSLTFFVTGAQFLVKKGSPIKGLKDTAGTRVAAQQGSTNAKIIRGPEPTAQLREFPDQPAAFQALAQLKTPAGATPHGRVGDRRRLLLLRAVRHGAEKGRLRLSRRRQQWSHGRHRFRQVLRDLRQVVRA